MGFIKKKFLVLTSLALVVGTFAVGGIKNTSEVEAAESQYSYTFTKQVFSASGTQQLGDYEWNLNTDAGNFGFDSNKGQQLGSKKNPASYITLSSVESFTNISSITINTSGANDIKANLSVKVGDATVGSTVSLTTTATPYTFENINLSGNVSFNWDVTQRAVYIKSISITWSDTISYTVTYDPNGGECSTTSENVEEGQEASLPTPTKEGYTFLGWTLTNNGDDFVTSPYVPTGDVTLYAKWEELELSINEKFEFSETMMNLGFNYTYSLEKEFVPFNQTITRFNADELKANGVIGGEFNYYASGSQAFSDTIKFDADNQFLSYNINGLINSSVTFNLTALANTSSTPTSTFTLQVKYSDESSERDVDSIVISNNINEGHKDYTITFNDEENKEIDYLKLLYTKNTGNIALKELTVTGDIESETAIYDRFNSLTMKFKNEFNFSEYTDELANVTSGLIVTTDTNFANTWNTTQSIEGLKALEGYKVFENESLKDSFLVGIHVSDEQLSGMKNTELYAVSYISTDNGVTFNTAKTYSLVSLLNVYAASEETIEYENGVVVKVSDLANSFLAQLGE